MNEQTRKFIKEHEQDDVFNLSLQLRGNTEIDAELVVRQINGRKKIKSKVPTFYQNDEILYPVNLSLEQASSGITTNFKSSLCRGNSLVDLTGGFGIDCSFMSRNFQNVVYVERNEELCKLALHNFSALQQKYIEVVNEDALNYLSKMDAVDCIYLDPARRSIQGKKVFMLADCEPDVAKHFDLLLSKSNVLIVKLSPMLDITQLLTELKCIAEVHIVSVENDCKEILLVANKNSINPPTFRTVNFTKSAIQEYSFKNITEINSQPAYTKLPKQFLYEPNVSVLKAGAFKSIASVFQLEKLHVNTHLYTSNVLVSDFPGRIFEIENVFGNSKSELKRLSRNVPKANISVRNYVLTVEELRKKSGIKEGGDQYVFACKLADNQFAFIQCRKHETVS